MEWRRFEMMKNNLVGKQFGKLKAVEYTGKRKGHRYWQCVCDCGNFSEVRSDALTSGNTSSCGCTRKTRKGMSSFRIYKTWSHMMDRCYSEKYHNYANYGGRGIKVHEPWHDFITFYRDVVQMYNKHALQYGEKETTLDRINSDGNYEPRNIRFATYKVQANNRRNNKSA